MCIPLPWSTRLKIALGAAKGLAFLHESKNPVIYRDFKASNILLDSVILIPLILNQSSPLLYRLYAFLLIFPCLFIQDFTAKLADLGLAKDGPQGDQTHISTRVMGTQGYTAPEYIMTGNNIVMYN